MKTTHFKYTPVLLVALFASSNALALSYGGSTPGDHQQYVETPLNSGLLAPDNAPAIQDVINVNGNGNKGNTELFATSESVGNTAWTTTFNDTTTLEVGFVDLNGLSTGSSLALSSLTYADWGTPGSGGLLDNWSTDLLTTFGVFTPGNLALFQAQFVAAGGEQRLSDPNIQSINVVGAGLVEIGLAGFYDASLAGIVPPDYVDLIKGGQISEIVKATVNGDPNLVTYLYAIGATPGSVASPSDVESADGTGSFTGNFLFQVIVPDLDEGDIVAVPEPTELALLIAGLAGFLGLRRKAV